MSSPEIKKLPINQLKIASVIVFAFLLLLLFNQQFEVYFHLPFSADLLIGFLTGVVLYLGYKYIPIAFLLSSLFHFLTPWETPEISTLLVLAIKDSAIVAIASFSIKCFLINNNDIGLLKEKKCCKSIALIAFGVLLSDAIFTILLQLGDETWELILLRIFDDSIRCLLGIIVLTPLIVFGLNGIDKKWRFNDLNTSSTLASFFSLFLLILALQFLSHLYHAHLNNKQLVDLESNIKNKIENSFLLVEQRVLSLSRLFANSLLVTPSEFNNFVEWQFEDSENFVGFSWNKIISETQLPEYLPFLSSQNFDKQIELKHINYPSFTTHDFAVVVDKIYPYDKWQNVIGLDVITEENRRRAIEKAISTNNVSYTDPISLLQLAGTRDQGILIFSPCCNLNKKQADKALAGFSVGVVNVTGLIRGIVDKTLDGQKLSLDVFDTSSDTYLFYQHEQKQANKDLMLHTFEMEVKDSVWQISFYPEKGYWNTNFDVVRVATIISIILSVLLIIVIINNTIRKHQVNAEAKANAEFIHFISLIEEIIYSKLTKADEVMTITEVYTRFLEATNGTLFNESAQVILGDASWVDFNNVNLKQLISNIRASLSSDSDKKMVVEKIGKQDTNYSLVLIPWVAQDNTLLVMALKVNSGLLAFKYEKLCVLNKALNKVNAIRNHTANKNALVDELKEVNSLLAQAESVGEVGSFKINFEQRDASVSSQLLVELGLDSSVKNPFKAIWQSFSFTEKKRFISRLKEKEGEANFSLTMPNSAKRIYRIKWITPNNSLHKKDVYGVVGDITEQLIAEEERKHKELRDQKVKDTLHELTFNIAGSSNSLDEKMLSIAEKARELFKISRASIWFFENDNVDLVCKALSTQEKSTSFNGSEFVLNSEEFPQYFAAMQTSTVLIIPDGLDTHPCTQGMYNGYIKPLNIYSLCDFPIIENNNVVGVICLEQQLTHWEPTQEEILIGNTISAILAKVIETEEKLSILEQLLTQQHEREQILSSMVDSVITIDTKGIIQTANKATERTFGYAADELIGQNVNVLMQGAHRASHDKYISNYIATGDAKIIGMGREVEGVTKAGKVIPLRLSVTEIEHYQTHERVFVGVLHDLSVEVEQRKRIIHSEKMDALGVMTGGIAHDFNNILGIMLGYTEMIQDECADPEINNYAEQIEVAGERAKEVISQIRNVSKSETLEQSVISPGVSVIDSQVMLSKALLNGKVELVFDQLSPEYKVLMNKGDFESALLNLCINAMHASVPGQKITIEVLPYKLSNQEMVENDCEHRQMLKVSVSDDGVGMSDETKERLFEPFYSTKGEQGTGLGLAQVYGFVQRTKGFVQVKSALGHGSTISLFLPINKESEKVEVVEPSKQPVVSSQGKTILLAEDEDSLREIIANKLNSLGYQVFRAKDGEQAIKHLRAEKIDILLTDVIMPNVDGIELANYALTHFPAVKIQLMSGFSDMRQNELMDERLYHQRMVKPFKLSQMVEVISKLSDEQGIK